MKTKLLFIIIVILSFNMGVAQPSGLSPATKLPEEVIITGIVKNEAGTALANAKVKTMFNNILVTDNNGSFSFALKKDEIISQSIFFSYDSLVTAVRSYHPVMGNTVYNIILHKPAVCCRRKYCDDPALLVTVPIQFKKDEIILSDDIKKKLDNASDQLKGCPKLDLHLTAHAAYRKSIQEIAGQRLAAIKKYLIEQDGISVERIKTDKTMDKESNDSIDLRPE